jgi:tetratricopeptide (TPR) repeat protein
VYSKLIKFESSNATAYFNRGLSNDNLKRYNEAIQDYQTSINLNFYVADSYKNIGKIYYDLKQYQLAIDNYSEAISFEPQNAKLYTFRVIQKINFKSPRGNFIKV